MYGRKLWLGLCLSFIVHGASAATVTYVYTGSVAEGFDRAGLFGGATDLVGQSFTLIEQFDTARAAYRDVGNVQSQQQGGSALNAAGSARLTLTIGGGSRTIADAEDYIYNGSGQHLDFVKDPATNEYGGVYFTSAHVPADYGTPLDLTAADATFTALYSYTDPIDGTRQAFARLAVAELQVSSGDASLPMSPVPLPGSFAMFGAGLVALGAHGFKRRREMRRAMARAHI